jgi:hypothetical protein
MTEAEEEMFRKFREAEIKAGQNVDPNEIMTLQEVHEFGIEIIENYSKEEGFEIVAVSNFLHENPQIVLKKDEQLYFVIVKTGPANGTHLTYDKDIALKVYNNAQSHHAKVLYAGVGLYCVGYGHTLVRNKGFKIDFRGFEDVDLIPLDLEDLLAFDQYKRIKWNLDENKKPKPEVIEKVNLWISNNEESIVVQKLRNREIVNIHELKLQLDYQTITDLMTIYPDLIFEVQ